MRRERDECERASEIFVSDYVSYKTNESNWNWLPYKKTERKIKHENISVSMWVSVFGWTFSDRNAFIASDKFEIIIKTVMLVSIWYSVISYSLCYVFFSPNFTLKRWARENEKKNITHSCV